MKHRRSLCVGRFPRALYVSLSLSLSLCASKFPQDSSRRLSLLPVANKQICLSLGIQLRFRLGEDRAACCSRKQPRPAAGCRPLEEVGQREFTMYTCPPSIFSHSYFRLSSLSLSLSLPPSPSLVFAYAFSPLQDNPVTSFYAVIVSPFSIFHAFFLHPSLSSLSCDFTLYSLPFLSGSRRV